VPRSSVDPLTDRQLDAWRAFIRAHAALLDVLGRELEAERGVPLTFYDVFVNLSEAGGRLRMSDLADAVVLSRSGVTRVVDRMEKAGYVRRERCPSDRRGSFAVLTPKGRRALRDAWPVHARGVAEHFARNLSDEEAALLADVLRRMAPETSQGAACG
jgi:DNA-binding MarR family transcriptional regulator